MKQLPTTAATRFPSPSCRRHVFDMTWGGVRGGGNPDIRGLGFPPPCPSPTRGEGTLRPAPRSVATTSFFVASPLRGVGFRDDGWIGPGASEVHVEGPLQD